MAKTGESLRLTFSQDVVDELLHPLVVRASPVDAITGRAQVELIVVLPGLGGKTVTDGGFVDRLQQGVTMQAALKRFDRFKEVEAMQYLS
jgi:hypothetical protein